MNVDLMNATPIRMADGVGEAKGRGESCQSSLRTRLRRMGARRPGIWQPKAVLIVAHMRSRSSLLAHVLGSNSEIAGYSELHMSYRTASDLVFMRLRLGLRMLRFPFERYMLDKVLHNSYEISPRVLDDPRFRWIFLVREPRASLESLIRMSRMHGIDYFARPGNALGYYQERLACLGTLATRTRANAIFIESDELISYTERTLIGLTDWLELGRRLSGHYRVFRHTGRLGHGDPQPNIRAGLILRSASEHVAEDRDSCVSADVVERGLDAYHRCLLAFEEMRLGQASRPQP